MDCSWSNAAESQLAVGDKYGMAAGPYTEPRVFRSNEEDGKELFFFWRMHWNKWCILSGFHMFPLSEDAESINLLKGTLRTESARMSLLFLLPSVHLRK